MYLLVAHHLQQRELYDLCQEGPAEIATIGAFPYVWTSSRIYNAQATSNLFHMVYSLLRI
jgi:hypothetical protein